MIDLPRISGSHCLHGQIIGNDFSVCDPVGARVVRSAAAGRSLAAGIVILLPSFIGYDRRLGERRHSANHCIICEVCRRHVKLKVALCEVGEGRCILRAK